MEKDIATIRLLFTRHGETQENHKGIICGQQPGTLTKLGRDQAKKIGIYMHKEQKEFDHIYVSDLGRTVQTFNNIKGEAKHLQKVKTTLTPILRQKSGGVLEGKQLMSWKLQAQKEKKDIRQYKCEKGESWQDVNTRCFAFLQLLVEQHILKQNHEHIFAVAHGGYLMQFHNLVRMAMEKQEAVFKNTAANCSFHEFVIGYPLGEKEYNLEKVTIECTQQNLVAHLK